jgi:drug/metabolite transporter (DMT)-like permease
MSPIVFVLALSSAAATAGSTILIRQGLRGSTTYTGFWINLLVGTVGLWVAVLFTEGVGRLSVHGFALFALAGLIGTTGGRLFRFLSIEHVGASISSALINLNPLVSTGLAVLLLGERVTLPILAGTVVIVGGTILLSLGGRQVGVRPAQLVLPLMSAVCFGVVAILRKTGLGHTGPVLGSAINASTALVAFTAFLLASGQPAAMRARGRSLAYFVAAGFAENGAVFLTVVALGLGTVSVVTPLTATAPIFTLFLTYAFLQGIERLTARIVGGTLLIVFGVYLITALARL